MSATPLFFLPCVCAEETLGLTKTVMPGTPEFIVSSNTTNVNVNETDASCKPDVASQPEDLIPKKPKYR